MTSVSTDRRFGINSGAAVKVPCRCASTAALTLNGLQTVDGIVLAADDRVLVKNQNSAIDNGIYSASTGNWSRAPDFDGKFDVKSGTLVLVNGGTANGTRSWRLTTADPVTIESSSLIFALADIGGGTPLDDAFLTVLRTESGAIATTQHQVNQVAVLNLLVFDPSIDNTGVVNISVKFQAALTAAAGKRLWVPNGTYLFDSVPGLVPSNTIVEGESYAAILKTGTNMSLYDPLGGDTPNGFWALVNSDWGSGNTNIVLRNLGFLAPSASNKGACHFRNVINLTIEGCRFDNGGPSCTLCTNFSIKGNYCFDCINAGLDNWDGCSFGTLDGNHILGNGHTTYGILVTGVTTDTTTSSPCSHMKVINNQIKNVTDIGVWIQGSKGAVRDSLVEGNSIDTVTAFHGIRISDSERINCSHNHLKNLRNCGINLQTEGIGGSVLGLTQDCIFEGNTIQDSNAAAAAGINAIENHAGDRNTYVANKILGALHKFAFSVTAGGDSCRASDNTFTTGVTGSISDAGTNTKGSDIVTSFRATDNSGTSYGAGPTNVGWSGESFDTASTFISPSFIAKRPGKYQFNWTLTHTNGVTANDRWDIKLVATGITVVQTYLVQSAAFNSVANGTEIDMASGDTAKLTITRAAGAGNFILHNDPTFNYFSGFFVHD